MRAKREEKKEYHIIHIDEESGEAGILTLYGDGTFDLRAWWRDGKKAADDSRATKINGVWYHPKQMKGYMPTSWLLKAAKVIKSHK